MFKYICFTKQKESMISLWKKCYEVKYILNNINWFMKKKPEKILDFGIINNLGITDTHCHVLFENQ